MRIKQDRPAEFYQFTREVLKKSQDHPATVRAMKGDDKERGQKSCVPSPFHIRQRNLDLKKMFEEIGVELIE